jgi:Ferritin-like domain
MKEAKGEFSKRSNRRSFLKNGAMAAGAAAIGTGLLGKATRAFAEDEPSGSLRRGDAAILRFLLAAEIIESDLWQQYAEFGSFQTGGSKLDLPFNIIGNPNAPYVVALSNLDGDMAQYIADNTDDEFSHMNFLRAYLNSKGAGGDLVAKTLNQFRNLKSSPLAPNQIGRLTNLMELTVDTSWWTRYRSDSENPDLDANPMFAQAVPGLLANPHTAIPRDSSDTNRPDKIQVIANTAAFHFAFIEQGGSSLYPSLAQRVSDAEVLRILLSIGPTETSHFQTWHDKAGNAVQPTLAPLTDPDDPNLVFGNLNDPTQFNPDEFQTNLIMPEPTVFLSRKRNFPIVSIIRPTETVDAAKNAVKGLTADGLFTGQPKAFFDFLNDLAEDADEARRE